MTEIQNRLKEVYPNDIQKTVYRMSKKGVLGKEGQIKVGFIL